VEEAGTGLFEHLGVAERVRAHAYDIVGLVPHAVGAGVLGGGCGFSGCGGGLVDVHYPAAFGKSLVATVLCGVVEEAGTGLFEHLGVAERVRAHAYDIVGLVPHAVGAGVHGDFGRGCGLSGCGGR